MGVIRLSSGSIRRCAIAATAGLCALSAAPAHAAGNRTTNTVEVYATVLSSCRLVTKPLVFGLATSREKTKRASVNVTFRCTPGTVYTVGIDNGLNWDGTTRRMWGGQAEGQVWYADYRLYRDPAYLLPWGMGPTERLAGVTGVLGLETVTIYGEASLKNVREAPYQDTVTVVVDF